MMRNNDIEKNFKDKLESYERFEGDRMAMWENIEKELEEKKDRKFIWFWLFPILLGFIGGTWIVFGKEEIKVIEKDTIGQQDIYNDENMNIKDEKIISNNTSTKKQNREIILNKSKTIQQQNFNNKTSKLKLFNTTSLNSDISNKREHDLTKSQKLKQDNRKEDELKILKKELDIQFLPTLDLPFLDEVDVVPVIDTVMLWKVIKEKNNHWFVRLGGGVNSMNTGFNNSSTNNNIHAENLMSQPGWNFLIEIERTLPKNFLLTSGVHFNRNWLRLKYKSTTTTPTVLNDVVLRYDIDLLSGDTTNIIGDTILNKVTTRDIQHHNQYDKFKIPVLIGKRWENNRFSYGGSAGIGLDFWVRQSGKYLSEDELVNYDSNTEGTSLPKLGWSAEVRGDFSFELKKKVNFFAQPYLSIAMKNWSIIGDNAIQKPMIFGTNFGLQIKF